MEIRRRCGENYRAFAFLIVIFFPIIFVGCSSPSSKNFSPPQERDLPSPPPPSKKLDAPYNLDGKAISFDKVQLTWRYSSNGHEGFEIEQSTDNKNFYKIKVVSKKTFHVNIESLQPATTYYFRVRAFVNKQYSAYSNVLKITTSGLPIPKSPSQLDLKQTNAYSVFLSWKDNSDNEEGFEIERNDSDIKEFKVIARVNRDTNSFKDTNLLPQKKYRYRVRAYNNYGYSGYSDAKYIILEYIDRWLKLSNKSAPVPTSDATGIWTGSDFIIFGGVTKKGLTNTGEKYNPMTESWQSISSKNAPEPRNLHTAIWTGTEMIIWGGCKRNECGTNTGAIYNLSSDKWKSISTKWSPSGRAGHTAIWADTEMIVWGGRNKEGTLLQTGGLYNPYKDSWRTMDITGAPSSREFHTAVWTNNRMIIFGGRDSNNRLLSDGGIYDHKNNKWESMPFLPKAEARIYHQAVWTGNEMIIWGGKTSNGYYTSRGWRFDPKNKIWSPMSVINAPSGRQGHTLIWTGTEVIVWGGWDGERYYNSGYAYNPQTDRWRKLTTTNAPSPRKSHISVWNGNEMIIWGGEGDNAEYLNSGYIYTP